MDNIIKNTSILEITAVFDEGMRNRYELNLKFAGEKGKKILVIGLNPTTENIKCIDTTTKHLINNLGEMGYSEIVVWNLFSMICPKLKITELGENTENIEYLKTLLEREFDNVLLGYGNTYIGNKKVEEMKDVVKNILIEGEIQISELVDKYGEYTRLQTMHPLFAGQRYNGAWKLRNYVEEKKEE